MRISFSGFSSSIATIGDIDGDGIPDYVVGASQQSRSENLKQGCAFVFSGQNGRLLFTIDLPQPRQGAGSSETPYNGASFGWAVAAAGDVNSDGTSDLLIGAFNQGSSGNQVGSGEAYLFNGKTGALLSTLQAPQQQPGASFGWAVASLGDLNKDSVPELVVGAIGQEGGGRVFIFSGKDRSLLHMLAPPSPQSNGAFGWSIAPIGDLDGDNAPDVLVGAPYAAVGTNRVQGQAYAFSSRTGKLLYTIDDPAPHAGATFGWHVAAGGDFNGDGVPDVLVGAPYKDVSTNRSEGEAFVFNGVDGALLFSLHNPAPSDKSYSCFGLTVAASPDVNGDGIAEILVSAPYQTVDQYHIQGEVFLFDGRTGRHLSTIDNPAPHQGSAFGYVVVSPGDVNGDRIPDLVISAAGQTLLERYFAVGRVYIFLSRSTSTETAREPELFIGRREAR